MVEQIENDVDKTLLSRFVEAKHWIEKRHGKSKTKILADRLDSLVDILGSEFITTSDVAEAEAYVKKVDEIKAEYVKMKATYNPAPSEPPGSLH